MHCANLKVKSSRKEFPVSECILEKKEKTLRLSQRVFK